MEFQILEFKIYKYNKYISWALYSRFQIETIEITEKRGERKRERARHVFSLLILGFILENIKIFEQNRYSLKITKEGKEINKPAGSEREAKGSSRLFDAKEAAREGKTETNCAHRADIMR